MRPAQPLLLAVLAALLVAPPLQMALGLVPERPLDGVERRAAPGRPAAAALWDRSFQEAVEAWFRENIGLRGHLVRTDNQLSLSLFGDAASRTESRLVLGRGGQLFERGYIDDLNRAHPVDDDRLERLARDLRALQDGLRRRGCTFLLVISPNKAMSHADDVPPAYRRPERAALPTNHARLLPRLVAHGVQHLDARAFLSGSGRVPGRPLFPRGGIHWSASAAYRVAQELVRRLEASRGVDLVGLEGDQVSAQAEPLGMDDDLARLANVWDDRPLRDPLYFYPVWRPEAVGARPGPTALVVGSSFVQGLLGYLDEAGTFADVELFWYYRARIGRDRARRPLDPARLRWDDEVFARDVVIIEANEAVIADAGFGFVADALRRLDRP